MKLHFSEDWLRRKIAQCEPDGVDPPGDENGIMACSPEIYREIMKMTTQVQIEVTQQHIPVIMEVVRSDGTVSHSTWLPALGSAIKEYVHFGQWIRLREATPQELQESTEAR